MGSDRLYAYNASLVVVPLADTILPPVSSKVLKQVVLKAGGRLADVARSRGSYKPLFISMLYRGDRPLYSRGEGVLQARRGEELGARIALIGPAHEHVEELLSLAGSWRTSYGEYRVKVSRIDAKPVSRLSLPGPGPRPGGVLRLVAKTPVVIASKTLYTGPPEYSHRVPGNLYRLFPSPGLLAASLLRQWNTVLGGDHLVYYRDGWNHDAGLVARAAEVYMAELDYEIRPETLVVGKTSRGTLRLVRGWRGWILYRVAGRKLARLLDRLLALATVIGMGKSRGIGLGEITAEWVEPRGGGEQVKEGEKG